MARYRHSELAVRLRRRSNLPQQEPGIAWARLGERHEKDRARNDVLELLTADAFRTKKLRILTFPGIWWEFERLLIAQRIGMRPGGDLALRFRRLHIVALEREETIFRAAVANMPRFGTIRIVETPTFATAAVKTECIQRFFRTSFEDYVLRENATPGVAPRQCFDAAWLDFNGHIGPRRLEAIGQFWNNQLRRLLVVTLLNGRTHPDVGALISAHGTVERMLEAHLPGACCERAMYYGDGAPMVQVVLRKSGAFASP